MESVQQNADERNLLKLDQLATLLDSKYKIPGTDIRVGVDALVGLIPGIGDVATTGISIYIIAQAAQFDVPKSCLYRMAWNVAVDTLVGTIPVLGDLFDVGWKANIKNIELLRKQLNQKSL